ncbi:MAG: hypothetical protein REH83_04280 [Rickettsiella sp.]|nr:hypothetical protein [Rickettsiella sp.]
MSSFVTPDLEKVGIYRYSIPIRTLFSEAWCQIKGIKKAFWGGFALLVLTLLGIFVIFQSVMLVCAFFHFYMLGMLFQFIGGGFVEVFRLLLSISLVFLALQHARNQAINSTMVFEFRRVWKPLALIGIMLYLFHILLLAGDELISVSLFNFKIAWMLVSGIGFFVLAFLCTYIMLLITMAMLLILDKNMKLKKSLKQAFVAVNQHWFKNIALLLLASVVLIIAGTLTLGIGLIWLLPFLALISAIQYQQIFCEVHLE